MIPWGTILVLAAAAILVSLVTFLATRYRRCPPNRILVISGVTFGKYRTKASKCIHGGGAFVLPLIQEFDYMSLVPMTIEIDLTGALTSQNIRVNIPSTFTIGISTEEEIMNNAANRLLGLPDKEIIEKAGDIIIGQLRQTVAEMTIEEINKDRDKFLQLVQDNVAKEINKIGLHLVNVNIKDITDESGYIESIGRKAAAEALNRAKIDVAEQEKQGAIGESVAVRDRTIAVANNVAEGQKGEKSAEADRRIFVQGKESEAIQGENRAKAEIAASEAQLEVARATAKKTGEVAQNVAEAEIQRAHADAERQRLTASEVIPREIEKRKIEIAADAEAERLKRIADGEAQQRKIVAAGEAEAILVKMKAEGSGLKAILEGKAAGFEAIVKACGDAGVAANMLIIEQLQTITQLQVEAIKNLKVDKLTVWDGGDGKATGNAIAGLLRSLPGYHEVLRMAGLKLPEYLGTTVQSEGSAPSTKKPQGT